MLARDCAGVIGGTRSSLISLPAGSGNLAFFAAAASARYAADRTPSTKIRSEYVLCLIILAQVKQNTAKVRSSSYEAGSIATGRPVSTDCCAARHIATDQRPSVALQERRSPPRMARTSIAISSSSSKTSPVILSIGMSWTDSPSNARNEYVGCSVRSNAPLHEAQIAPFVPVTFTV